MMRAIAGEEGRSTAPTTRATCDQRQEREDARRERRKTVRHRPGNGHAPRIETGNQQVEQGASSEGGAGSPRTSVPLPTETSWDLFLARDFQAQLFPRDRHRGDGWAERSSARRERWCEDRVLLLEASEKIADDFAPAGSPASRRVAGEVGKPPFRRQTPPDPPRRNRSAGGSPRCRRRPRSSFGGIALSWPAKIRFNMRVATRRRGGGRAQSWCSRAPAAAGKGCRAGDASTASSRSSPGGSCRSR